MTVIDASTFTIASAHYSCCIATIGLMRNIRRDERDHEQHADRREIADDVRRGDAEQHWLDQRHERERRREPGRDAAARDRQAVANHQARDVRRRRADRHAHGELARPLRDRIRHDAIETDGRQKRGGHRKREDQEHRESAQRDRVVHDPFERTDAVRGQGRVDRANGGAHGRRQRGRIARRPHQPPHR
jgi:hypothetical protein